MKHRYRHKTQTENITPCVVTDRATELLQAIEKKLEDFGYPAERYDLKNILPHDVLEKKSQ